MLRKIATLFTMLMFLPTMGGPVNANPPPPEAVQEIIVILEQARATVEQFVAACAAQPTGTLEVCNPRPSAGPLEDVIDCVEANLMALPWGAPCLVITGYACASFVVDNSMPSAPNPRLGSLEAWGVGQDFSWTNNSGATLGTTVGTGHLYLSTSTQTACA